MKLAELETQVLALPAEDRSALARRIWDSLEEADAELDSLIRLCDEREREADAEPDGWMPVNEFMDQMRARKE